MRIKAIGAITTDSSKPGVDTGSWGSCEVFFIVSIASGMMVVLEVYHVSL